MQTGALFKIKLTGDIDLSGRYWTPIGIYKIVDNGSTLGQTTSAPFRGYFDGGGFTITGLYVDERTTLNAAGLFGYIGITNDDGNEVGASNLTIEDAVIYSNEQGLMRNYAGIFCAFALTNPGTTIVFENITVSGKIITVSTDNRNKVGGLAGDVYRCEFKNCHADGVTITGAGNCGGFVGAANGGTFEDCSAAGEIDVTVAIGGFVGYSNTTSSGPLETPSYSGCTADVDVTGSSWKLGGFVGSVNGAGEFQGCAAYGDVDSTFTISGYEPYVGGFVGENKGSDIKNPHSTGIVKSSNPTASSVGGFAGYVTSGSVANCSFIIEKNPGLNGVGGVGSGTIESVEEKSASQVLDSICTDVFGGHSYEGEWHVETAATCTAPGNKYQLCTRCNGKGNYTEIPAAHSLQKVERVEATTESAGTAEHWACSVCGLLFSDENGVTQVTADQLVIPIVPTIIKGNGSSWQKGSTGGLEFTSTAEFSDFIDLQLDGSALDVANYETRAGSTIVTLKAAFLDTLGEGQHTITVRSNGGSASATFTVAKAQAAVDDSTAQNPNNIPNTGDDSGIFVWVLAAAVAVVCMVVVLVIKRRACR